MADYRRAVVPGGTFFFTVNVADRRSRVLTDNVAQLRAAFRYVRLRHPFAIEAIVVLSDHLHSLWTLPAGDGDFALRWRLIKSAFSRSLEPVERISQSRLRKGERGVWQRRYWEHVIRDEDDFVRHLDYIHFNPVKHRNVDAVGDWPYSSFHRFVQRGHYPAGWSPRFDDEQGGLGEQE